MLDLPATGPRSSRAIGTGKGCALLQPYDMEVGAGHLPHRHLPARARPGAVARRLRAAVAPPQGRPLRREPEPAAALLPVPGGPEALAARHPRPLPRLARGARLRPQAERRALRRGRLGEPDARRLGPGLGSVAERHGDHAVHLLPAGGRPRLQAGHRRDHLRPRAPRDVPAGRGERLRPRVDRVGGERREARLTYGDVYHQNEVEQSHATTSSTPTPRRSSGIFGDYEAERQAADAKRSWRSPPTSRC